jgi:HTH-type transcriptional regulator/antitoxin HigA
MKTFGSADVVGNQTVFNIGGNKVPLDRPDSLQLEDPEYDRLLHKIQPRVPTILEENERLLAEVEKLMSKGEDNLTPAGDSMLGTLFSLVRAYEERSFPQTKSTPAEMLEFLMEQNQLSSADLPLPANRVSEILSGKRAVSKEQAKRLGAFFHISPAAFI